jgi:hypothetical protein
LSQDGLAALRAAFAQEFRAPLPPSLNTPGDAEIFFRTSDRVPVQRTNGGRFEALASPPARQWLSDLRARNRAFWNAFQAYASETYSTNKAPAPAWSCDPADALFALGSIVRRLGAEDGAGSSAGMHVDGGPSMVFLAISLAGQRIVEFEEYCGSRHRLLLQPGDWYVSSPACIRHRVLRAGHEPSTTLLLRTAVLARRASEKRVYGTRGCFERLARATADIIDQFPLEV